MITATGQDVFLSNDKFEIGRNFGTKIWNAARFIAMQSEGFSPEDCTGKQPFGADGLHPDDKHILSRLQKAVADCTESLEKYRFNDAAHALYEFVWHQFCDWYVEYSKEALYGGDTARREQVLKVLHYVFANAIRLLHPMMPFVTEELWHAMGYGGENDSIMHGPWPGPLGIAEQEEWGITSEVVDYVDSKHELIRVGRTMRADYGIVPSRKIDYLIKPNTAEAAELLSVDAESIKMLLRAGSLRIDTDLVPDRAMPSGLSQLGAIYMPLEGLVDIESELARLSGQLEKVIGDLERTNRKLDNESFVSKAPTHVVEQQRVRRRELVEKKEKFERLVATLSEMAD